MTTEEKKIAVKNSNQNSSSSSSSSTTPNSGPSFQHSTSSSTKTTIPENFISSIIKYLKEHSEEIIVSEEISFDVIDLSKIDSLQKIVLHCILNGPVGVNKDTNFPGIETQMKVNSLFKKHVTNTQWRGFCLRVANMIKDEKLEFTCKMKVINGDYWPIREYLSRK